MPQLRNARHERFAQEIANGKTLEEAHRIAGFRADRRNAFVTRQREDVTRRIAEILASREMSQAKATERAIERAAVSKEWVLLRLRENVERAMQFEPVRDKEGNDSGEFVYAGAVANRALELLGKELGMFIERRESGKPGDFANLSDEQIDDEILKELLARGMSEKQARVFIRAGRDSSAEN